MGGSSRSSTQTTNVAHDNRTFITDQSFTRIGDNITNDIRNDIDNSVSDSFNTTNEIDNSVRDSHNTSIHDAYNTTVESGAIYATDGASVTVNETNTDHGAIEAALGFAERSHKQSVELSQGALQDAFKSTVGGLQDQQNKWLATVSGLAVAAVAVTAFAR